MTKDGANIYVRSQGNVNAAGNLILRFIYETGSPNYFWLNNIITVGVGSTVANTTTYSILRIDTWYYS